MDKGKYYFLVQVFSICEGNHINKPHVMREPLQVIDCSGLIFDNRTHHTFLLLYGAVGMPGPERSEGVGDVERIR